MKSDAEASVTSGTVLTGEVLRKHAKADRTPFWESQARQLLAWAGDVVDAAEAMKLEAKR